MINAFATIGRVLVPVFLVVGLAGCGTGAKEKTAPCKRPANLTSYAPDPRQDCGPMANINGDPSQALAAINALASE